MTSAGLASSDPETIGSAQDGVPATIGIPAETIKMLREALGVDLTRPEGVERLIATLDMSVSHSPYPAPEMPTSYEQYRQGSSQQVIAAIDEQRRHRLALEDLESKRHEERLDRAQRNAFFVSVLGLSLLRQAHISASVRPSALRLW
jgi:hypothetical protein